MIELPEAMTLSRQLNETVKGKTITKVVAAQTEHKLTWYYGNRENYQNLLQHQKINNANAFGGFVEISVGDKKILFNDGVNLRFYDDRSKTPKKHQLLIEFSDKSILCASVQMYGGLGCFVKNELENTYYSMAKEKPTPLLKEFDVSYYHNLIFKDDVQKLSLKAFLATKQRIPGLGNGVLQDILFNAKIHPKQKVNSLTQKQISHLYISIKNTLKEMVDNNGRNTEKDLFFQNGGYITKVSKHTVGNNCKICDSLIVKGSYLGGSIYYCSGCQPI